MGYAAKRNPRAYASPGTPDERTLARLRAGAAQLTRVSFERCLLSYPAEHRDQVRALLQPSCPWTVENRRRGRLMHARWLAQLQEEALAVAEQAWQARKVAAR